MGPGRHPLRRVLAGSNAASVTACMRTIGLCSAALCHCFGVLRGGLCGLPVLAEDECRQRIGGLLLLSPHFLLIVCIVVLLVCGKAPQGSRCFNDQFASGVFALFILPLPTLVGTSVALSMFRRARRGGLR